MKLVFSVAALSAVLVLSRPPPLSAGCVQADCSSAGCSATVLQSCNDDCTTDSTITSGYVLSIALTDARCATSGGNCPSTGNCVGDLYGKFDVTQSGLTGTDIPLSFHWCHEWVDCAGNVVC